MCVKHLHFRTYCIFGHWVPPHTSEGKVHKVMKQMAPPKESLGSDFHIFAFCSFSSFFEPFFKGFWCLGIPFKRKTNGSMQPRSLFAHLHLELFGWL